MVISGCFSIWRDAMRIMKECIILVPERSMTDGIMFHL